MIARSVAIEAARSSDPVAVPSELSELAGPETAVARINEELAPRRLQNQSFVADEKALKASVKSAAWDVDLRKGGMPLLEQSIAMRQDRLAGLRSSRNLDSSGARFCCKPRANFLMSRSAARKH